MEPSLEAVGEEELDNEVRAAKGHGDNRNEEDESETRFQICLKHLINPNKLLHQPVVLEALINNVG